MNCLPSRAPPITLAPRRCYKVLAFPVKVLAAVLSVLAVLRSEEAVDISPPACPLRALEVVASLLAVPLKVVA